MSGLLPAGAPGAAALGLLGRRLRGAYDIDEWGLDPELVALSEPLIGLRWDIRVDGAEKLPSTGGAVLVHNRRFGLSESWVLARGIRQGSGRFVRTVGVTDIAPIGPLLRRFGGVVDRPDEIAGLLRAGQLVGLAAGRNVKGSGRVGDLVVDRIEAARVTGSPVVPVALVGHELGRRWRVIVGDPVTPKRRGGPLAGAELAEATRAAIQALLDDAAPAGWF